MKKWPYIIIVVLFAYIFFLKSCENKKPLPPKITPPKTNTVVIEKPAEVIKYDTIKVSEKEVKIVQRDNPVNAELLNKYKKAKDSITKLNLYKNAIKERNYINKLTDSLQTITVESNVIGHLERLKISYRTNPIAQPQKPVKNRTHLYLGMSTMLPTNGQDPSIIGNMTLTKDKHLFSVGYGFKNEITVGYSIRIF